MFKSLPYGQRNKARFRNTLNCVALCKYSKNNNGDINNKMEIKINNNNNNNNKEPDKIVLVTNYISVEAHKETLTFKNRKPNSEEIEARSMEILSTLQANLNHESTGTVVVLVESRDTADWLSKLDFDNSHKLLIQNNNAELSMPATIDFATRCFQGHTIAIANQDVILGDGWNNLDHIYMSQHKIIYALTRHDSILNPTCTGNPKIGICDINYGFSHDAFVLHATEHIRKLTFEPYHNQLYSVRGIENYVIWALRHRLNYDVKNPCSLLRLHHEHCVPIRNRRGRYKVVGNVHVWEGADFTDSFY